MKKQASSKRWQSKTDDQLYKMIDEINNELLRRRIRRAYDKGNEEMFDMQKGTAMDEVHTCLGRITSGILPEEVMSGLSPARGQEPTTCRDRTDAEGTASPDSFEAEVRRAIEELM